MPIRTTPHHHAAGREPRAPERAPASRLASTRRALLGLLAAPTALCAAEIPVALDDFVVSVARAPQETATLPILVHIVPAERLASTLTVDAALREDPAFSLFRRNSSLSANPTAHGVSLRGVGPSGASRTAVMLDDIPLNDPFGGWITWGQIPSLTLAGAEIAHGGGSGTWGSSALGGTVALASTDLADSTGAATLQAGSHGLWRGEFAHTQRVGGDSLRLNFRQERYGGFFALRPEDRGAVDRRLDHRHAMAQVAWRRPIAAETEATLAVRAFDEERGNGTILQENATRLLHAAFTLEGRDGLDPLWKAGVWAQRQKYSSFFSAVSADRMSETPANDQDAVPASAAGFHGHRVLRAGDARTVVGADGRWVEGETREKYLLNAGVFTRRRIAGGTQRSAGVFVHHDRPLARLLHLSAALRTDVWSNVDGRSRERSLLTGQLLRDEAHRDRDGITFSPRLGLIARPAPETIVRAAVYRAFRLPTLNEYYRPFRVGSTNTLANPELELETLHGIDLSAEQRLGAVRLTAGVFFNRMDDAVGNVTLSTTPTLTTRQRRNIDETRIQGLELAATWAPVSTLDLRLAWMLVDAEVVRSREQPALEGRRLAQVPHYSLTAAIDWRATPETSLGAFVRAVGRQYEDDENQLPLHAAWLVDVRVQHRVNDRATGFLEVHNLLDRPAQTSRSAAGLVTWDEPRSLRGGITLTW